MRTLVASLPRRAPTAAQLLRAALARPGRVALLALVFLLGGPISTFAAKWDPIDPADLAAKESAGSPGADTEILLSTHVMEETSLPGITGSMVATEPELVTRNFVRAKVYTAKGVQDQGKLRIEFISSTRVERPEARVVKPDGSSVDLKKSDIFESVLAEKKDGESWKRITFVFPNLEPGDVVEYRWIERLTGELWLQRYFCQESIPVREYRFTVGNMNHPGSLGWVNCPKAVTSDKDGFTLTVRDQPAFEEDSNMPPEREFRGWIYVTKTFRGYATDESVWKFLSGIWADAFATATRPGSTIKKKAESLVVGATSDEEKLRRLYEFCQKEIFNTTYRTSAELQAEIEKHKDGEAQSAAKTLEKGRGRWDEVNFLFAALARGVGFEVREARTASREEILNVRINRGWAFLNRASVAVKQGAQWSFFDPGSLFAPFGMMGWRDETAVALVCDLKKLEYASVPGSPAERTQVQRKGRFTLDAEGTLEGEAEEVFSGHLAAARKADTWSQSLDDVNKDFRAEVTKRLPNAEVSEIAWTNLQSIEMPLTVKYRVRIPSYAEQAGKRLVFAPAFFASGKPVVFAAAERKFPIFFSYPWGEHDDIEIVLPEGYTLDKPSAPVPVGELTGAFGAGYKLQYLPKTRTFAYRRDFVLGANGAYTFRLEAYPVLKGLFEGLHKSDTHSIMLKPKEAAVPATGAAIAAPAAQP